MSSDSTDTRTRILNAALSLLEAQPAKLPRMSDIARAAGVSRQALYLHFPGRLDLLVATTRHQDRLNDIDARLAPSRSAATGLDRLDAFVTAWGSYLPVIYPVARAILAEAETDAEAKAAWDARMADMREGCAAAVAALRADGTLPPGVDESQATDLLWSLLSLRQWEMLTRDCGWSQDCYLDTIRALARATLGQDPAALTRALACGASGPGGA